MPLSGQLLQIRNTTIKSSIERQMIMLQHFNESKHVCNTIKRQNEG